ncbi:YlcI/YnfO family protein [Clostridium sp.]|uniref:YlcI/YnfO family protein n=1 Tax=Clostridium sp. TaxID=1506 RepID=UPI0035A01C4C
MRKIKQISVRFDDELHKEVKYLLVDIDKSFNEYILDLVRKDLERRKKEKE